MSESVQIGVLTTHRLSNVLRVITLGKNVSFVEVFPRGVKSPWSSVEHVVRVVLHTLT